MTTIYVIRLREGEDPYLATRELKKKVHIGLNLPPDRTWTNPGVEKFLSLQLGDTLVCRSLSELIDELDCPSNAIHPSEVTKRKWEFLFCRSIRIILTTDPLIDTQSDPTWATRWLKRFKATPALELPKQDQRGIPPFGYKSVFTEDGIREIEPDQKYQSLLDLIVRMYTVDMYSVARIADELNTRNIRSCRGGKFSARTVCRFLDSRGVKRRRALLHAKANHKPTPERLFGPFMTPDGPEERELNEESEEREILDGPEERELNEDSVGASPDSEVPPNE